MEIFKAQRAFSVVQWALSDCELRGEAAIPVPDDPQERNLTYRLLAAVVGHESSYVMEMLNNSLTSDFVTSTLIRGLAFSEENGSYVLRTASVPTAA